MGGLAREFRKPLETMHHVLDACAASGMAVDARMWLAAPPRSSYPACHAVKAAAELWRLAAEGRVRAGRVLGGALWQPA